MSRETGKVVPLAGGERVVALEKKPLPPGWRPWQWPRAFTDFPTPHIQNGLRETRDTRGLIVLDGKLYLPFYFRHRVRAYDTESGDELFGWPVVHPAGITLNDEGLLLIATERRIVKYSPAGTFFGDVVVDHLGVTEGLAVGPNGRIYVTDLSLPSTIKVFSPEGRLLDTFGSGESLHGTVKPDKLYMPFGIDVGHDGHIYIAEWLFERVQKLSPDWNLVWSAQSFYAENCCADRGDPSLRISSAGSQKGQFLREMINLVDLTKST